jgi:pimeloyl-ACP methyl ester carboxylesterase
MSSTEPEPAKAATIVLIHGMWLTPHSWEPWIDHYTNRGHRAIAPGWPGIESPEQIRRDPSPLRGLGLKAITDHYDKIVRGLNEPPILVGHSFGGLVTQLLLDRGLGAAGVAIGTGPPRGVIALPLSTIRSGMPGLKNPLNRNGLAPLTPKQFRWRFTNTLGQEESDVIYREHYIPGTNRAFFDALGSPAAVDFANPQRPPLLLIGGEKDHISPPALTRTVLKLQGKASSVTEAKEYAGRTHFMAGMDGWEEIADYALNWALEHQRVPAGSPPLSSSVPSQ